MDKMVGQKLRKRIVEYLQRPDPVEVYKHKKTKFVEAVVEFFSDPTIEQFLEEAGKEIPLIEYWTFIYDSPCNGRPPEYKVAVDKDGISSYRSGTMDAQAGFPATVENWYELVPYDLHFSDGQHFNPTSEEFISGLERKVEVMLR